MEKKVLISEPFVFKSSEENERIIRVEFLHMWNDLEVYECLSRYTDMKSKKLLFQPRNIFHDYTIYNIYEILNDNNEFSEKDLDFAMIGNFVKE